MVVQLARGHLEEEDDRRVERTNPAQLEVFSGVEHEPVRPGSQRRVRRHQRPQTSVRVRLPVAHELPLIGFPTAFQHNVYACGRTPERCVEDMSRDRAQAGNCTASMFAWLPPHIDSFTIRCLTPQSARGRTASRRTGLPAARVLHAPAWSRRGREDGGPRRE